MVRGEDAKARAGGGAECCFYSRDEPLAKRAWCLMRSMWVPEPPRESILRFSHNEQLLTYCNM